ncbi:MAG: SAM-dependent methyltransferase [Pyrinomonadaceae bacterium]
MPSETKKQPIELIRDSIVEGLFVRLNLSNHFGEDKELRKILIRRIDTSKGPRLHFLYKYATRDLARNFATDEAFALIDDLLKTSFKAAHLFTTKADYQIKIGKRGNALFKRSRPTFTSLPDKSHDRKKVTAVDRNRPYLRILGIVGDDGKVRSDARDKWRQINAFVEVLERYSEKAGLNAEESISLADMGCGKGYLTFAAYDFLNTIKPGAVSVTGVDANRKLVSASNELASACGFEGLGFESGEIREFSGADPDILVALHACDTASDEAIYKGIRSRAKLLLISPCCHKEARKQIRSPEDMPDLLADGIICELQAEILTDSLRSLILKSEGYETSIFEFVASEHTPKNRMIAAVRSDKPAESVALKTQIDAIKNRYAIQGIALERLLYGES